MPAAAPRAHPPKRASDAKVITYSRRRNKAAAAKARSRDAASELAADLGALAVATPTRAEASNDPEAADARTPAGGPASPDLPDDGAYDGPYDDSDSDCGGPGTALKRAQSRRQGRAGRLARGAAAKPREDDAAVRAKLAAQREFFAEVDGFSLASESEHSAPSPANALPPNAANAADAAPSHAAAPANPAPGPTPGTKRALTSEWLDAIPEAFSPAAATPEATTEADPAARAVDLEAHARRSRGPSLAPIRGATPTGEDEKEEEKDEDDVASVDVEEEFVDSDEEAAGEEAAGEEAAGASPSAPASSSRSAVADSIQDEEDAAATVTDALARATLEDPSPAPPAAAAVPADLAADLFSRPAWRELLSECGQREPADVESMADTIRALTAPAADPASDDALVRKIGEGTYGEAFKIGGTVLKIVPAGGDALINGEPQMGPAQIRAEAAVAKRLAKLRGTEASCASSCASSCAPSNDASSSAPLNATAGFIDTRAVRVCRGPYAPALLRAWAASDAVARSENENPAHFAADQTYVVFACADGGADLEHVELRTFAEACAVLLQVTTALAVAEEACRFEHRDLHWGNVLLRRCGADETRTARLNGVDVTVDTAGLEVSIIDFTLSRLDGGDGGGDEDEDESAAVFCDLNADPELFAGPEGHCQSDTYRKMRDATGGRWERHCPKTNALWLRYLADCLAEDKAFAATKEQRGEMRRFRKRCAGYESAADALWDELFVGKFTTGTSLGR